MAGTVRQRLVGLSALADRELVRDELVEADPARGDLLEEVRDQAPLGPAHVADRVVGPSSSYWVVTARAVRAGDP